MCCCTWCNEFEVLSGSIQLKRSFFSPHRFDWLENNKCWNNRCITWGSVWSAKKKLNDILENLPTNEDEVYGVEVAENGNDCFNAWNITQRQHQHMCSISLYFMSHLCLPIKMKFHKNGINNRRASFFFTFFLSFQFKSDVHVGSMVQWFNIWLWCRFDVWVSLCMWYIPKVRTVLKTCGSIQHLRHTKNRRQQLSQSK